MMAFSPCGSATPIVISSRRGFLELLTAGIRLARTRTRRPQYRTAWAGTIPGPPRSWPIAGLPSSIATASRARRSSRAFPATRSRSPTAVRRHPPRFVGFFMFNPAAGDVTAGSRARSASAALRGICLFPAMHGYRLDDERVKRGLSAAARARRRGVRALRRADGRRPQEARAAVTVRSAPRRSARARRGRVALSRGAGDHSALRRRDLARGADGRRAVPEHPPRHVELERLDEVLPRPDARGGVPAARSPSPAPDRLLFGTDSSFFPRGWQQPVYDAQEAALRAIGVGDADRARRSSAATSIGCFPDQPRRSQRGDSRSPR